MVLAMESLAAATVSVHRAQRHLRSARSCSLTTDKEDASALTSSPYSSVELTHCTCETSCRSLVPRYDPLLWSLESHGTARAQHHQRGMMLVTPNPVLTSQTSTGCIRIEWWHCIRIPRFWALSDCGLGSSRYVDVNPTTVHTTRIANS